MSNLLYSNDSCDNDLLDNQLLDGVDYAILKSYESMIDCLAMLIGGHCEIVLHSLEDLKCSAVRIANG